VINRRSFLAGFAAVAAMGAARAQQPAKVPRVGVLFFGNRQNNAVDRLPLFRQRLRELVDSRVDVIVASAVAAAVAARQATATIPIVMLHAGNPIGAGLIASLAHPGGNVTGTANLLLGDKQLELIRQLVPSVAKVAVLGNPTNAGTAPLLANITDAARGFHISVVVVEVSRTEDFPGAFAAIRNARPDVLMVLVEPMIGSSGKQIRDFAAGARLPTVYDFGQMARAGGLVSYAPAFLEHYTLAADYVDKILKGAKPGDLPVEQPTKLELILNKRAARAFGLTIPPSILLRTDQVIE
jgi:putative tryptophan/tyrosine transport system substrate-binding protein